MKYDFQSDLNLQRYFIVAFFDMIQIQLIYCQLQLSYAFLCMRCFDNPPGQLRYFITKLLGMNL